MDMSAARRFISWFWLISPRASFIPAKLFFACVNPEENASLNISVIELVKFTASRPQTPLTMASCMSAHLELPHNPGSSYLPISASRSTPETSSPRNRLMNRRIRVTLLTASGS
jgi:hypothetical protein